MSEPGPAGSSGSPLPAAPLHARSHSVAGRKPVRLVRAWSVGSQPFHTTHASAGASNKGSYAAAQLPKAQLVLLASNVPAVPELSAHQYALHLSPQPRVRSRKHTPHNVPHVHAYHDIIRDARASGDVRMVAAGSGAESPTSDMKSEPVETFTKHPLRAENLKRLQENSPALAENQEDKRRPRGDQKDSTDDEPPVMGAARVEPVCGYLHMQVNTVWKKLWCRYVDGVLTYRAAAEEEDLGSFKVSFIRSEGDGSAEEKDKNEAGAGAAASVGLQTAQSIVTSALPSGTELDPEQALDDALPLPGRVAPGTAEVDAVTEHPALPRSASASLSGGHSGNESPSSAGADEIEVDNQAVLSFRMTEEYAKTEAKFWDYMSNAQGSCTLTIVSPSCVHTFRADTTAIRSKFVDTISRDLQRFFTPAVWAEKAKAAAHMCCFWREQYVVETERLNSLLTSLARVNNAHAGMLEDQLPITSVRKEKSGVLGMELLEDTTLTGYMQWKDLYFVLFEGALYFYKDSKSTAPAGFVSLRFASVLIEPKRLSRGDFVFHVQTPLQVVVCRTKHPVALSEWVASLENSLCRMAWDDSCVISTAAQTTAPAARRFSFGKGTMVMGKSKPSVPKMNTSSVLHGINELMADLSALELLIQHPSGMQYFHDFVRKKDHQALLRIKKQQAEQEKLAAAAREQSQAVFAAAARGDGDDADASSDADTGTVSVTERPDPDASSSAAAAEELRGQQLVQSLEFYSAVLSFCQSEQNPGPDNAEACATVDRIFERFLADAAPNLLFSVPPHVRTEVKVQLLRPERNMFDHALACVHANLDRAFEQFRETPQFAQLSEQTGQAILGDTREVAAFPPGLAQGFLIKVKGTKRSRDIKFDKKLNVITIGRDKSNTVVIDDSRVSRSHARVMYSETQCEYIDLGSSCGSKLNGKSVLRARLTAGDVLELGQSTLIFFLRKKKFSLFG